MTYSEPALRVFDGHGPLAKPTLEQRTECGVVFEQLVDEIVLLFQRDKLEGWHAIHRDYDRLISAEPCITAQTRFGLTQRNHFHGVL